MRMNDRVKQTEIPKIIHYCWFGKGTKPAIIKRCINSWKKYCPDYDIIEWNENNFDIESNVYCKTAYDAKKWAFVSDYVRLKVLYEYGGIYMDTDVELIKSLQSFMMYDCFLGFQHEKYVSNGLVTGAVKFHPFIAGNLKVYENMNFSDESDSFKLIVCQEYTTNILKKHGLKVPCDGSVQKLDKIIVFPPEYFCPYDHRTFTMNKTENTVAIHHFASSWWDADRKRQYNEIKRKQRLDFYLHTPNRFFRKVLGTEKYEILKSKLKGR